MKNAFFILILIVSSVAVASPSDIQHRYDFNQLMIELGGVITRKSCVPKELADELAQFLEAEFKYYYGNSFLTGCSGIEQQEAKELLSEAVGTGHNKARTSLGYMLVFEELNVKVGIKLLEIAARNGHFKAMLNLYAASQHGYYDKDKGLDFLLLAAQSGSERAMVVFAQDVLERYKKGELEEDIFLNTLQRLKGYNFSALQGQALFLTSQYFGQKGVSIYSELKRDYYLHCAAVAGHLIAINAVGSMMAELEEFKKVVPSDELEMQ